LLNEVLNILWLEENMDNDLTKCLRQEIIQWTCTVDHPACMIMGYHELYDYLQNSEQYP